MAIVEPERRSGGNMKRDLGEHSCSVFNNVFSTCFQRVFNVREHVPRRPPRAEMRAKIEKKSHDSGVSAPLTSPPAPRRLAPVAREDVRAAPRRSPGARRALVALAAPPAPRARSALPARERGVRGRVVVVLAPRPRGGVVPEDACAARPTTRTRAGAVDRGRQPRSARRRRRDRRDPPCSTAR